MLLTDFFTGSQFTVEIERDLSEQQQFLDVLIVRRGRGRFLGRLPDGLEDLAPHNLITFKSHREALDPWAMKELLSHSVAYRKLVSPSPELIGFGQRTYRQRSARTSRLFGKLFESLQEEDFAMSYTREDFERDYVKDHFPKLLPEERREVLQSLPPEDRLAGLSEEQIRQYLDQLIANRPAEPRKRRRKR